MYKGLGGGNWEGLRAYSVRMDEYHDVEKSPMVESTSASPLDDFEQ